MIRFREFLAGTLVSKSTVIAKNVRSFFEIIYPFESKHDRTQHLSSMTRNMTVVSKSAEGIQSHLSKSIIFISKGNPSIFRRESHHHLEVRIIHHFEEKTIVISKRQQSSFRRDSHHHFEKNVNHHIERTGGNHFKTIVLPVINHP